MVGIKLLMFINYLLWGLVNRKVLNDDVVVGYVLVVMVIVSFWVIFILSLGYFFWLCNFC